MRTIEQHEFDELTETYAQLLSNDYEEEGIEVTVDEILEKLDTASDDSIITQIKNSEYDYLLHPFKYSR